VLLGGFAAIAYGLLGVADWNTVWGQRTTLLLCAAWSIFGIWTMLRVQRALLARQQRARVALFAVQKADMLRSVEALATEPEYARWAPLIRRWFITRRDEVERHERRYRELLADPVRAHHAAGLLEGRFPNNWQIDYADDPTMTATCEHLVPVERELRAQGQRCWLEDGRNIGTSAILDPDALRVAHALPDFVVWQLVDYHPHDYPHDYLACTHCNSRIESNAAPPWPAPVA
jgi:hypothetical protein